MHAIAGRRQHYRPVKSFRDFEGRSVGVDGNAGQLIQHYIRTGLRKIYLADLDCIESGVAQSEFVASLLANVNDDVEVLLDAGVRTSSNRGNSAELQALCNEYANVTLVIATETAHDVSVIEDWRCDLGHGRVAVSLDYRNDSWCSKATREVDWLEACRQQGIAAVIALDVSTVGGNSIERTKRLCKRMRDALPDVRLISGGGIRSSADALEMQRSGADALLVASWFIDAV